MINVIYQPTLADVSDSTLAFLEQRPMMKFMTNFLGLATLGICAGYGIAAYTGSATHKDLAMVIMAVTWLIFYKTINKKVIQKVISKRNIKTFPHDFNIDKQRIFCKTANQPYNIEWKNIKFVIKKKDGYIMPLSGFGNAGKFLWLPNRAFSDDIQEQNFVQLLRDLNKKIKLIK